VGIPRVRLIEERPVRWNPRSGAGDCRSPPLSTGGCFGGLSRAELARRADLTHDYLFKVESGNRGCNPEAAEELAAILEVDLRELRIKRDDAEEAGEAQADFRPSRTRIAYRQVHQAYLRILLLRAGGSAYAAMDERQIEKHCEKLPFEGVIEVVRARRREIEYLVEYLGEVTEDKRVTASLPAEVSSFLKAVLDSYPDLDIRLLAAARRREGTEEGR
jgi:transcriptional regulator with XRE-family HTH domain